MIGFWDNDIIHKLAALDLIDECLMALSMRREEVRVLPTARFKFGIAKGPDWGPKKYGAVVFARIHSFIKSTKEAADPDPAEELILANVPGIDAGEAILFSNLSMNPGSLLLTGDKRALAALASTTECAPISQRTIGRVMCLEQIVQQIINVNGFYKSLPKIVPAMGCDTVIRSAFGSGMDTLESSAHDALSHYVADLRSTSGGLLRV